MTDNTNNKKSIATRVLHAGFEKPKQGQAFSQGPTFASAFHLSGAIDNAEHQYARFSNPTWGALESAFAQLEGGETVVFPSGMAAGAAIMSSLCKAGDKLVLPADGYYATRAYAEAFLQPNGICIDFVKTSALLEYDFTGTRLVFVETPSNPMLDVVDIQALSEKVHAATGLLAIDNTTATILAQQPLALGADISMSADTKALNGHSDVVFGHVSSANTEVIERIRLWRKLSGNIPGPMETWLVHRGLATLDVRLERMANNAMQVAKRLQDDPNVSQLRYPGLQQDPSFAIASKQMGNFGFIISFDLGCADAAQQFIQATQLIFEATSFGGVHSMAERRARWGTDAVPEGLVRLSVGCERVDDLLADIAQALKQTFSANR